MRDPLSTRSIAEQVGKSQTAIARWRRDDLQLSAEVEARVLRVIRDEQARVEQEQIALRLIAAIVESKLEEPYHAVTA